MEKDASGVTGILRSWKSTLNSHPCGSPKCPWATYQGREPFFPNIYFFLYCKNFNCLMINWIIVLQYYVDFCYTTMQVIHKYSHVPPSWTPPPSHPSRLSQSTRLSSIIATSHWLPVYIWQCMFQCYSPSSFHPLLAPRCPQACSLCGCLYSCPENRFISTIFF